MTQPPYGSNPGGQPSYPAYSASGQGYPGQPTPGAYPPAPAPGAYPAAPAYTAMAYSEPPLKKSPILGVISLALVVVGTVIGAVAMVSFINVIVTAVDPATLASGSFDATTLPSTVISAAQPSLLLMLVGIIVGLVGWIMSIVATASARGRVFGIIGIIGGVLALFIVPIVGSMAIQSLLP